MTIARFAAAAALVCSLALSPAAADATVMVRLSRETQVAQSDLVVRVTALSATTRWNEDGTRPLTLTRLAVREYLKGSGPTELTLRQFGGTVDGETMSVPGDGHLRAGAEYVVFLRQGIGVVYLTAMAQSVYAIVPSQPGAVPQVPQVRRDLTDVAFVAPDARGALVATEAPDEPPEPLAHLVETVAAAVRAGSR